MATLELRNYPDLARSGLRWIVDHGDYVTILKTLADPEHLNDALREATRCGERFGWEGRDPVTCGTCGTTWDDALTSDITPTPSGRCPFEYDHVDVFDVSPDPRTDPAVTGRYRS